MMLHDDRRYARLGRGLLSLALMPVLGCGTARAQAALTQSGEAASSKSADSKLEEIVVTARKRPEKAQKIPESVTVISAGQLAENHATRLDDLATLVPNLNIVTRADNTPDVTIRGVGSFGVTPGVGFYVNDIPQFEGESVRPDDVASIDVLKGPQGTLYGGNNIGGAIKYTTKQPTSVLSGQLAVAAGSYGDREVSGEVSGPITPQVGVRVSAFATQDDGFDYDSTLKTTLGGAREQGGRITAKYAGEDTTATFYLFGDQLRSRYENLYYAPPDAHTYSLQVTANVSPYYTRSIYAPSLVIDHQFENDLKLTSITSFFHADSDARTDGDHVALPIFDVFQTLNTNVETQELRLSSTTPGPFKWVAGVYGERRTQYFDEINFSRLGEIDGNPADSGTQHSLTRHAQEQLAAFGDGTFSWGRWDFEGGLRIEYYHNQLEDIINGGAPLKSGTMPLPKGSITYHVDQNTIVYGSVSEGLEPADNIAENAGVDSYKSETTTNFELGEKTTVLDQRLRLNADAFYIHYANRLFSTINGQTLQGITTNIGSSYNYGLEFDAAFRATREISLTGSLGLTQAVWQHALTYDPTLNQVVDLNGRYAPFTPKYQASITLDWRHHITDALAFSFHTTAAFFGQQWWDVTDHYQQQPYNLVNFGADLEYKNYSLSANLKNAFDERYNTIFAAAEEIGSPRNTASIGQPREFFVGLAVKY